MTPVRAGWSRRTILAACLICAATAVIVGTVAASLWLDRASRLSRFADSVEHDTLLLSQHTDGVLRRVETVLSVVAYNWETNGPRIGNRNRLNFLGQQLPEGACLTLFTPTAAVLESSCPAARRTMLPPDTLQRHANRRAITILGGDRIRDAVSFSRSAIAADGSFLGVVMATFNAAALLGYDRSPDSTREQVIVMPDGTLVAATSAWGEEGLSAPVRMAIPAITHNEDLTAIRIIRHDDAITAGVLARAQPLIAIVSADTGPTLQEWQRDAMSVGALVLVALAGMMLLLHRLHRAERAQAEAEFAAERERTLLNIIVANAPVGIWMMPADRVAPLVNKTFAAWTGWYGNRPSITGEELIRWQASDEIAAVRSEPLLVDEPVTFVDGVTHTLQVAKQRVLDPDGNLMGVVGVGLDITERKAMEEALRSTASRLDAILKNAPVGIAIEGTDRRIQLVNPRMLEICHRREEDMVGAPAGLLFACDADGREFDHDCLPMILKGSTVREERSVRRGDGTQFWASLVGRMVSPDDPSLGIVWAIEDVTDRRTAEDALRRKTTELEQSNAELEAFAYMASHDLRQPLRTISSYLGLIEADLADRLDADGREYMDFCRAGAARMDRLIVDLLEYSRVGRKSKPFQPYPSADILAVAVENLDAAINEAGASVTVDAALPMVLGDDGELVRLFQNLIGNAIKYRHRERPPAVHVGCAPEADSWHFTVADNGIGIAPEHLERVFGIFQRLHRSDEYEGTGIGLAVCRKIVERHGGHIWVESTPDKGSIFHVTLARDPGQPLTAEEPKALLRLA